MLSRVAESIYWLNRYIERAENIARTIDVNLHLGLDMPGEGAQWAPIVDTTGDRPIYEENFGDDYTREQVIQFLTFDPDNPNSIMGCVHRARENARAIRDTISSEMWEQVNRFYLMVRHAAYGEFDVMTSPCAMTTRSIGRARMRSTLARASFRFR